jgi:ribokinase
VSAPTIAVIGHVEHITLGHVPSLPGPGDIAHLADLHVFPGGGGGVTLFQLLNSPARVVLFSALGNDDAANFVEQRLRVGGAELHLARRSGPHTRDVVLVPPSGERTIVVVGQPLHPERADALPWERLASCDAAYFTAQDPEALRAARAARILVVTARRRPSLVRSGVRADVIVGSALDPREASTLADYPNPPSALVMTEGERGGYVETSSGRVRFDPGPKPTEVGAAYGAGDSFAGALTYFLACGLDALESARRSAAFGAAVLGGSDPLANQIRLPTMD